MAGFVRATGKDIGGRKEALSPGTCRIFGKRAVVPGNRLAIRASWNSAEAMPTDHRKFSASAGASDLAIGTLRSLPGRVQHMPSARRSAPRPMPSLRPVQAPAQRAPRPPRDHGRACSRPPALSRQGITSAKACRSLGQLARRPFRLRARGKVMTRAAAHDTTPLTRSAGDHAARVPWPHAATRAPSPRLPPRSR